MNGGIITDTRKINRMKKIVTPNDYVAHMIKKHPTLYATHSYEASKFLVLDQLLNVNGNGIRCDSELKKHLRIEPNTSNFEKYLEEDFWRGYKKVRELYTKDDGTVVYVPARGTDKSDEVECLDSEKHNHPDVLLWYKHDKNDELGKKMPYPNFSANYSTVYQCPFFLKLGDDWLDAAIWFYKEARERIEHSEGHYYYEYPCETEKKTKAREQDQLSAFKDFTNEEISVKWNHPYDGDIVKFLTTRWQKEKDRIFMFIEKTVSMLENSKGK